jgi:hypothetical protein
MLITAPAVPEIIATKTKHANSKRIAVTAAKKKHDEETVVHGKSKRIATKGYI